MSSSFEKGFFGAIGVGGAVFLITLAILGAFAFFMLLVCGGCLYIGSEATESMNRELEKQRRLQKQQQAQPLTPEEQRATYERAGREALAEEEAAE